MRATLLELTETVQELRAALPEKPKTELSRSQFAAMTPLQQSEFIRREGARVYDDPPAAQAPLPTNGIRRSDWDKLPHPERHRVILAGKIVID